MSLMASNTMNSQHTSMESPINVKYLKVTTEDNDVILKTDKGEFRVIAYATDGWINTHRGAVVIENKQKAASTAKLLRAAFLDLQARHGRKVWKV